MRQDWQDKIAASNAEMEEALASDNASLRCAARFSLAVTGPLNAWYAEELAKHTDQAVLMQVLPRCLGQMLGLIVHNMGGNPVLAQVALDLLVLEMSGTMQKAAEGAFAEMTVLNPGAVQ